MTTVRHATTVVERRLDATPERVFRAFTKERGTWDVPKDDWVVAEHRDDVRPDGEQLSRFGPKDDPAYEARGRYLVVRDKDLLIEANVMHDHDKPMTASMTTLAFAREGDGTKLTVTEQSAFFGEEDETMRKAGWTTLVDRLAKHLEGAK